jgi:murein DD-endopeptidase MepM/ murein hydrolase activator NlpD
MIPLLLWLVPSAAIVAVATRKEKFLIPPVDGKPIPKYGNAAIGVQRTATHAHRGVDIPGARNEPVRAAAGGIVTHAVKVVGTPGFRGYGRAVVIQHLNGKHTLYGHLETVAVNKGDTVVQGQVIGGIGDACDRPNNLNHRCGAPHLHYELSAKAYPLPAEAPRLSPGDYTV